MKLFPGVMLVMLLVARRFRAFIFASVSYLAIAAFMTRTFGIQAWFEFFRQQGGVADEWLGSIYNSSLPGLVTQLITPACVAGGHPSKRATAITLACSLALLAFATWRSHAHFRAARLEDPHAIDLPFALFALLSVFLNAWVWDHYLVLVVQPLFILSAAFWNIWRADFRAWGDGQLTSRRLFLAVAVLLAGVVGLLVTAKAVMGDAHQLAEMQRLWLALHIPFYHHVMHLLQVANFAPWMVPMLFCFLGLQLSRPAHSAKVGLSLRTSSLARRSGASGQVPLVLD